MKKYLPTKSQIQASTKARNNYDVISFRMYEDIRQLLGELSNLCNCSCTKKLVCSCDVEWK